MPCSLPPLALGNRGRGGGSPAAPNPAALSLGGGRGEGEKGQGGQRGRFPAVARAGWSQGGLATTAGGGGRRQLRTGVPEAWQRPWRWGKAPGDSVESITPFTLGRGDA